MALKILGKLSAQGGLLFAVALWCALMGVVRAESHYEIIREFEGRAGGHHNDGPGALALCEKDQTLFYSHLVIDLATGEISETLEDLLSLGLGAGFSRDCGQVSSIGFVLELLTTVVIVHTQVAQDEGYVMAPVVKISPSILASIRYMGLAVNPTDPGRVFVASIAGFKTDGERLPIIIEVDLTLGERIEPEMGLIRTIPLDPAGIAIPSGLDIDPHTMEFYVTDHENGTLTRLDRDGNLIETIDLAPLGIEQPDAVAFNPFNGHIFISDGSHDLPFIAEIALFSRIPARDWMLYE